MAQLGRAPASGAGGRGFESRQPDQSSAAQDKAISWDEMAANAQLFGVSTDSVSSHEKFIKKYQLPFPLLSDCDKKIVNAYGVWVEKSMYGKKYMGVERTTFVLDAAGKIAAILRKAVFERSELHKFGSDACIARR